MAKRRSTKQKEEFYVGIGQPSSINISILESKKSLLQSLQIFKEIQKVKIEKREQQKLLRRNLKAIASSLGKLQEVLPHVNISEDHKAPKVKPKVIVEREPVAKKEPVDQIEDQLDEIERKLASLQH